MRPQPRLEQLPDPLRNWPSRAAVAFIVITLIALVLVPWIVQRRVDALREEIVEASEPARTLIMQWQFNLVRELAALSKLLLTDDSAQTRTYRTAWAAERAIFEMAAPLVERMGPDVVERFEEARTLALQWHARVRQDELAQRRAPAAPAVQIPRERQLFEVVRAVAGVDHAIMSATADMRARIIEAERVGFRWTVLLGTLALISALAVFALHARVRRFAAEVERRRAESVVALAETARASEQRSRLLRGITHDVKNPLGAARGYAELLAMGVKAPLAPEQAPLVAGVERSIDSALAIIADLLDLARVDSGSVSVKRTLVDLNQLVGNAVEDYRASANTSGHTLIFDTSRRVIRVYTDPLRIRQVLDNLLSNALKYTPPGGRITARVALGRSASAPRPGEWATIEVSDTGPGIPREHRDAVFDEFTRLDDATPTKGHGLGLAIARGLSRQLGGDLTLADAGPGATFVLWVPQREHAGSTEITTEGQDRSSGDDCER